MACRHLWPLEPLYTGVDLIDQRAKRARCGQLKLRGISVGVAPCEFLEFDSARSWPIWLQLQLNWYASMDEKQSLSELFVNHAADLLVDARYGLTGSDIVRRLCAYAVEFNVTIPHAQYPFKAPNKRTAFFENVMAFSEPQRYKIILALCDGPTESAQKLKLQLMARYGHLAGESLGSEVNQDLIRQTRHWLDPFPDALGLFNDALQKYQARVFMRNLLDDLRLSLEILVQRALGNDRSLENQLAALGTFVKQHGGSSELSNMFARLVDYYCKYQNTYVKHDDAVIEEELEFVLEITAAFMKHFVRIAARDEIRLRDR